MVHIAEIAEGAAEPSKEDNKDATEPLAAAADTAVEEDTSPHELEQLPLPSQFQEPASLSEQQQPPPLPLLVSSHETPLALAEIAHSPVPEPEPDPKPGTATVPPSSSALVDDSQIVAPAPAPPAPVKAPYNEYALRVAYIMRSYLHMRPGGATANATSIASNGESCCRAMMEVTRKDNGRWGVSKVELEHTHQLDPPPDLAGALASGGLVPVLGMEFDSISAAKQYYSAYSEKMGFQSKTGSGKRSRGTRLLHMQRFLCSKGHFSTYSNAAESATRKRKRIPNKKAAEKEVKEVKTDCDALGVIQVESSMKKDGVTLEDQRREIHTEKASSGSGNDKRKVNDGGKVGKVALVSNPGQSRLLRELGIRVSRYSNEERRNIILKYMQKRSGRQAVDRSLKIPSRQALAERRQRGVGGKFLSREETQTMSRQEEILDDEPELPAEVVANAGGVPIVGMLFENEDKAYDYYIKYAGSVGFSVRKGWWDKSARNVTRSRVYVCSREGFRPKNEARRPRAETRTGCPARMAIKLTSSGKYRITEFVAEHNHQLAAPLDMQMLSSKKLLTNVQPAARQNASIIPVGYKNYLRTKRSKVVQLGDAGALFEYFQRMKGDNPSFYYAIQVDEYDQMTNVFWADAKSMMDYHYFGDVVCFDTSYKENEYGRPLALFLGVNHHRHMVIFAAAFLYDESVESFKWLFETFKAAMCQKQPHTIFTDRCLAISDAIAATWPGTVQRLCVWQIYQNATKQLADLFESSENFAHDFGQCIYHDFEDEDEFNLAWKLMLDKYNLKDNEWLTKLYEEKENWSSPYGRQTFTADIKSTLRAETLGGYLKEHLNLENDLRSFLNIYELLLERRRYNELQADYNANQGHSRIPPLRLLWQAANAYTPAIYDNFRREVELFLESMVYCSGEAGILSHYEVTVKEKSKVHCVRFDASNSSVICSCGKFEVVGIPCCHVLKVFDFRNIKELPSQYILKRWRKDAMAENLNENHGITLDSDAKSSVSKRYSSLCRTLFKLAARATENEEAFTLMVSHSDQLLDQVEQILQAKLLEKPSISGTSKGHPNNLIDSGNSSHGTGNDPQKPSGKKKSNGGTRQRHQNEVELNKRQKARKGQTDDAEMSTRDNEAHAPPSNVSQPRNPANQFLVSNQFMQGPFMTSHQFGVGAMQGYHPVNQFGQDSSAPTLSQQPFPNSSHFTQGFPTPDLQALQFIGNNAQLDHQSSDQGQCAIPVWDFL
ncbi:protein FAR1-RELATED SEQUENCE 12-like [Zingiber officinale]|uniref:protein FAR1-RELATED SEQUENCE 12-like n=1 Tax=Zingiber officinale TaxID=94328 RepID=UPI001C4B85D9|nr:protein FAR1-RELATED SEQUENCE 12-like [Zingiber officinale]